MVDSLTSPLLIDKHRLWEQFTEYNSEGFHINKVSYKVDHMNIIKREFSSLLPLLVNLKPLILFFLMRRMAF